MSADSSEDTPRAFLERPFEIATTWVTRYPATTLAIALSLAIAAIALSYAKLGYRTSRLDLLDPKSDYNQRWIEYINEFGDEDDAVVVVEGADRDAVVPVLKEVSQALSRETDLFHAVLHEVNLSKVQAKGLHYLAPNDLLGVEDFLQTAQPVIVGEWSQLSLGHVTAGMCARLDGLRAQGATAPAQQLLPEIERLADSLHVALEKPGGYQSPWPAMPQSFATLSELSSEYLLTKEGQLGFVLLRIAPGSDGFARGSEATDRLRDLIGQLAAKHPDVRIGLTGLPIMENDEMRASQNSMFWASLISFGGVGLLFIAGFGGMRHAILANLVLLLGMAWSFGYVTLTVGHLNILSVSFTVTMIGIGIDYGVHYIARYMEIRQTVRATDRALIATSRGIGPAITTGAITTAVSFFCAGLTDFVGVAELGIIAGGGILLCAVAELLVLPAAVVLVDRLPWAQRMPNPLPMHLWINPLMRRPVLTLTVTLSFTGVALFGLTRLWYDHNLLNMQPVGLESVELERKLLEECNQSMWYALTMADSREELLALKAKYLELDSVDRTEEIASMLPTELDEKRPIIVRIHDQLADLPERPPLIPVDRPDHLGRMLGRLQSSVAEIKPGAAAARKLEQVRDILRRLPAAECTARATQFQQQMAGDLLTRLHVLAGMSSPEPPRLEDLPASLVHRFVGHNGRHLLKIYGKGNIWDMEALSKFVADVRRVDPNATGNPLQAYEASIEMKRSYEHAAIYALLVNLSVLYFGFRSIRYTFLAMLPVGLGMLMMFGLMGLFNIPLNPANTIVLPLILGIGEDYGVHILHEFREQKGRYKMSQSIAVAVMVDSLTTIVGFGALMIASHQGLQSLGRVLIIGVSCCLFTAMVMLPALLTLISWNRQDGSAEEQPPVKRGSSTPLRRRDAAEFPAPGGQWNPNWQIATDRAAVD
jgi:hopanoid biosynthesis associated RND transporter like protein HpnN